MLNKTEQSILLFDGVCNLCIGSMNFIIKRDSKEKIKFTTLQSESGQELLRKFGLPTNDFNTVVFICGENYFLKSTAVLHVLKELGGVWKLCYVFIILPRSFRDFIYKIVAKTRYSIFGKRATCIIPTPETKQSFRI